MEEAPKNGKESAHSAHANGMNEWMNDGVLIVCCRTQCRVLKGKKNYRDHFKWI
jgi:hypothetical protein